MSIITKGLIGMEDLSLGTSTFTRATSTGGTNTLTQVDFLRRTPSAPQTVTGQPLTLTSSAPLTVDTESVKRLENIRFADQFAGADTGAKINAAITDLPAGGGTVYVPNAMNGSFATGIVIDRSVHLIFDSGTPGNFSYTGTGACITINAGVAGVTIEGAGERGISNIGTPGTVIGPTNTAAAGLLATNAPGLILRNLHFSGPSSGTGIGVNVCAGLGLIQNVQVSNFGGDGFQVNGGTNNSNIMTFINTRSLANGGNGYNFIGGAAKNANLMKLIGASASANTGNGFVFNASSSNVFVGAHSEASTGGVGFQFIASISNTGSIYSEPSAPETTAVTFDVNSKGNSLYLVNGTVVTDSGSLNQWTFGNPATPTKTVSGQPLTLNVLTMTAAAPTVAAAQVGFGSTTAATATAGGGQAALATVAGYLIINVAGTVQKIPYFNV